MGPSTALQIMMRFLKRWGGVVAGIEPAVEERMLLNQSPRAIMSISSCPAAGYFAIRLEGKRDS
jgi:hypothetical protein